MACLSLCCVVNDTTFVVHGGLPRTNVTVKQLNMLERFTTIPEPDSILEDILWSDPRAIQGYRNSARGAGVEFGQDVCTRFLDTNKFQLLIRSHECVDEGFEEWFDGDCLTIFSASNYCGVVGNMGAFCLFTSNDPMPIIITFDARDREHIPPSNLRFGLLREDIIHRLLIRLSAARHDLLDYYKSVGDGNTITRSQWSDGLKIILDLPVPFLLFQRYLGLPELGVDGRVNGPINYINFIARFQPVNLEFAMDMQGLSSCLSIAHQATEWFYSFESSHSR